MKKTLVISILLSILTAYLAYQLKSNNNINNYLPVYTIVPFIIILLGIAFIPLINGTWWHENFPNFSLAIGLPMAVWSLVVNYHWLIHSFIEYISFITLLSTLFIISGGILIKGTYKVTPIINTFILATGTLLASFIGTTGAAMFLIRPLIQANKKRKNKVHVIIFFIFLVANIGGALSPLGDPPLFLGFLQGVSFFWTLKLFPAWIFTSLLLLIIFYIIDYFLMKKEHQISINKVHNTKINIEGKVNFIFLVAVIATVLMYSILPNSLNIIFKNLIQIIFLGIIALLSIKFTRKQTRTDNHFTWFPIKEVAILFAGIFACMIPALKIIQINGSSLGISSVNQFFWSSGILSSFLDNAPSYLTLLSLAKSVTVNLVSQNPSLEVLKLFDASLVDQKLLLAISIGSVFMGANTYIGNGPNFMVKSIAEENGIKMPSFFGYMFWSAFILIPIFFLISFLFL